MFDSGTNRRFCCDGFCYYDGISELNGNCAGLRPFVAVYVATKAEELQRRPIPGVGRGT